MDHRKHSLLFASSALVLVLLIISGLHPYDRATWFMEVAPVVLVYPVLWWTRKRFPLTSLLYCLIAAHAMVLMLGGAFTYAKVPLGFELQSFFHLQRNPYDRIGHFFQGFVPFLLAREILIRTKMVQNSKLISGLAVCIVMTISSSYELIEWGAALALGKGADAFLGTQGDPWDTQSDMFMALIGAISALVFVSRFQDRQIMRLQMKEF
ncbi:DUF2238 domain-containing protein [Luteolibacter pohnpeiensis]|uniref:DUF2238 domain-containing protein n=1 Tax=Luteolibacter pohnpeiensis TaxID=454153 RepID=A0A934S4M7_9BACT|nr:DUF2238 domain-containing protein [Luteolibacter pohnpeiensis]MBK1882197.1 DUF2238 domain-containing protein [Luteolibacter pohnpeiensis]